MAVCGATNSEPPVAAMLSHIDWPGDLAATVAAHRELPCAVDETSRLTYGEFGALAAALARRLLAEGLVPGEAVATCLPNSVAAAWASAALRLAGAAETPLNPAFTAAERRYCLDLAGVRRVIAERGDADFFAGEGCAVAAIEEIVPDATPGTFRPVPAAAWGRISFTSGTTGKPKAIVHTHGARWIANLLQRASFWEMPRPESAILLMTPMTHGAGLIAQPFLDHGARLELRRGVDVAEVERLLKAGAIDHLFAPPKLTSAHAPLMLRNPPEREWPRCARRRAERMHH